MLHSIFSENQKTIQTASDSSTPHLLLFSVRKMNFSVYFLSVIVFIYGFSFIYAYSQLSSQTSTLVASITEEPIKISKDYRLEKYE